MKLRGWSIDGFGIFCGYNVRGVHDRLTVVFGPNEAGKSTLLAFIRNTLFGYPDGRSTEPRYSPLRGGKHGGRLFVEGAAGEFVIDRDAGQRSPTVLMPDNRIATDADLAQLLGHADRTLFRAVFAFGLFELQDFETLNAEGIRERIFSVGITGAGRSARGAAQDLEKRAAEVAREFPALTRVVVDAQNRLKEVRARAVEYPALLQAESAAEMERVRLDYEIERSEACKREFERLVAAWPLFYRRKEAEEQLSTLPVVENFPANAETRLAGLTERLDRRRESLEHLKTLQRNDELERQTITIDDRLPSVGAQLERLSEELALHVERLRKLSQLEADQRRANAALRELLDDLGPGWNVERLKRFDRSIPRQETIREWGTKLQSAQERVDAAVSQLQEAEQDAQAHSERTRILTSRLGAAEPPSAEEIQKLDSALRSLRATLATLRDSESALAHQVSLLEDRERDLEMVADGPTSPLRALIGTMAVALAVAGLVGSGGNWAGAAAMLGGGLIAAVLLARRQSTAGERHRGRIVALRKRVEEATVTRDGLRRRAEELRETASTNASVLGVVDLSWEAVEGADRGLRVETNARSEWDRRRSELDDAERDLEQVSRQLETLRTEMSDAQTENNSIRAAWEEWTRSESVGEQLTPAGVLELFETVRQARAAATALSSIDQEHAALVREVDSWQSVAQAVTGGQAVGEPLVAEVRARHQAYRDDRERRTRVDHLNRAMTAREAEIERATDAVAAVETERRQLIAEAGGVDDADFHQRAATSAARDRLSSTVSEADRELVNVIGLDDEAEVVRTKLATGHLSEWKQSIANTENQLRELRRVRDEALISERQARADREHLEGSADVAMAEFEVEAAIGELTAAVRRWQTPVLAKELIQRTLDRFIRDRQPEVLARSSPIFCAVTSNRYQSVVQDQAGENVLVVDAQGGVRGVDALSAGTAQQLYLAMRLALADEFVKAGIDLPLVLDDVLVNFDPSRANAMAQVLIDYSRHKQVLLFTCHPETRDTVLAVEPSTSVLEVVPVDPVAMAEQPAIKQGILDLGSNTPSYEPGAQIGTDETAKTILAALDARPMALSEIVAHTQLDEARCTVLLKQLRAAGRVDVTGHARGARWHRIRATES